MSSLGSYLRAMFIAGATASLFSGCGGKEESSMRSLSSPITLEGIVYLEPLAVAEGAGEKQGTRRGGPNREAQVLSQGQVEAYCAAAGPFRECPREGEYISSARVSSSGGYQIDVPSNTINEPGITLVARDEDGNVAGGAFVHSELYPTPTVPRQDLSPESTSSTQGLYGTLQRAQEEFNRISRQMYGRALQGYNGIFELVRDCFRQSTTLNVRSVFDKILEDEGQQTALGDIYRNRTGGSGDSASIGRDIAERARRVDLGGGSYIEVEGEVEGESEGEGEKPPKACDITRVTDDCFFNGPCYNTSATGSCQECCEELGCTYIDCSRDEVPDLESREKMNACIQNHGEQVPAEPSCALGGPVQPEMYIRCCLE